jgi:hypothetical protein
MEFSEFCQMCHLCWKREDYGFLVLDKTCEINHGRYRCGFQTLIITLQIINNVHFKYMSTHIFVYEYQLINIAQIKTLLNYSIISKKNIKRK